jgi:hypothetical protein
MEEGISPKKSKLLGRFILIIVAVILIVGLFGISKKVTLRTGECEASYKYYTLEPFVSNFLSCITTIPCGSNQWFVIHNAKVSIIKCLCENVEINKNALAKLGLLLKNQMIWNLFVKKVHERCLHVKPNRF